MMKTIVIPAGPITYDESGVLSLSFRDYSYNIHAVVSLDSDFLSSFQFEMKNFLDNHLVILLNDKEGMNKK